MNTNLKTAKQLNRNRRICQMNLICLMCRHLGAPLNDHFVKHIKRSHCKQTANKHRF